MHLSSASGRATSLVSLMKGGSTGKRRFGYVWLSFGPPGDPASGDADAGEQHYGLRLEYAASSHSVETVPFRLPVVPGHDGQDLSTMKRDDFCAWVAAQGGEVFASADTYVADLAQRVFGCTPGTLKRIARRIRKVRNPGLLAGLSPADAAAELRMALPTVSPDTVRSTQEALAAAEATRRRYERDAKTAQVLEDLSAAWSDAAAQSGLQAVDAALACPLLAYRTAIAPRAVASSVRLRHPWPRLARHPQEYGQAMRHLGAAPRLPGGHQRKAAPGPSAACFLGGSPSPIALSCCPGHRLPGNAGRSRTSWTARSTTVWFRRRTGIGSEETAT
ncbi:hypothetical protein ABTY00_37885 [Streptomyces microflavus]|uniref:hypothetical protein n=1 Tax=Streptomyces microflavus TaxID=1919 RepID=UPI003325C350